MREEPSIGVPFPTMHFPECIANLKGPRIDFSGSDWLEKHDAPQNMWDTLHKVRASSITRGALAWVIIRFIISYLIGSIPLWKHHLSKYMEWGMKWRANASE